MSIPDNAAVFMEMVKRKSPSFYDLVTARTDEEFERAFDAILEEAVSRIERDKAHLQGMSEDGISGWFASALSIPGLTVSRETHSNGHVDLTIEADHCHPIRRKLGEAKIYDGPDYHLGGLNQLLGRYTTGREGRGLMLEYVLKRDVAGLIKKIRERMDSELPHSQVGETRDHLLKWSFLSSHTHSCGDNLEVNHVACNLYLE